MSSITGKFADGQSSNLIDAVLDCDAQWIKVHSTNGQLLIQAPHHQVKVSSRLGDTPRTLEFAGAVFETPDNDAIDALMPQLGQRPGLLHRLESHLGMILFATVVTVGFVVWLVVIAVPGGARQLAMSLPEETVAGMGENSLDLLDRVYFDPSELDAPRQDELRQTLADYIDPGQLHFRAFPPNAFALPDGTVVITDGLVELAESDEELIAILFHEIGHVKHRHLVRRSLQGATIAILLFLITGDVSSVDLLVTVPAVLVDLAYSREFELEADHHALAALVQEGIDPIHFSNIMNRIEAHYNDTEGEGAIQDDDAGVMRYFLTHPLTEERIALVDEYRDRLKGAGRSSL